MKKGIIILAITIGMMLLFDKVNASTWQQTVVEWKNGSNQVLPNYYGQYQTFTYGTSYIDFKYNTSATIPNGAKGVLISINFRDLWTNQDFICSSEGASSSTTNRYCEEFSAGNGQNISFKIFYNNYQNASNCYFLGSSINMIDSAYGHLYTMIYCPLPNNINNKNIGGISYTGHLEKSDMVISSSYIIGVDKTIMWDVDGENAIIDNQNQNTDRIINENATYSDTPSVDTTNETQELDNYEQAEQNLINSLDLNMSVMDGITINPNASAYIWQIVDRLRQINPAIILLMTSILGMGIIKMVLNR